MTKTTTIRIFSGEGTGPGYDEPHTGKPTALAVWRRLLRERGWRGDRWAHAEVHDDVCGVCVCRSLEALRSVLP